MHKKRAAFALPNSVDEIPLATYTQPK